MSKELSIEAKESAKRLADIFSKKGWDQAEVGLKLGYERSIVNKYINAKQKVSDQFLRKLQDAYGVSREYILHNDGSPFIEEVPVAIKPHKFYGGGQPVDNDDKRDQTNVRVVGLNDPDVYQEVKFISYQVWATFTDNFGDFDFEDVKATYPVYLPRLSAPINEKHMVFEIMGDSMEERLYSRDVILTELVDEGNIDYINSGIYVVAYRNQLVIKRVIDNDLMVNGTLTLHSDNKKHGKIVIRREDIRYMWKFKAVVYSTNEG